MLVTPIIGWEIAFRALLGAGLVRYLLPPAQGGGGAPGVWPLVDLVLPAAAVADLREGGTAGARHALAVVCVGFPAGYGHSVVRRADVRWRVPLLGRPEAAACTAVRQGPGRARMAVTRPYRGVHGRRRRPAAARRRLVADAGGAAVPGAEADGVAAGIHAAVAASCTLWPRREPSVRTRA